MQSTKIAISSWGNIGQGIAWVCQQENKNPDNDMELVGIIRRNAKTGGDYPAGVEIAGDVSGLAQKPDVILCAAPSHIVMNDVEKYIKMGISTIDCFDSHTEINSWRERLDALIKSSAIKAVSITGSGWDPGFDSIQRTLAGLVAPGGETTTTFGPGRSMGHTTTVKSLHPEIKEAVALTLPGAKPGAHRREVYIKLNEALAKTEVQQQLTKTILEHPYFKNDDSHVFFRDSIAEYDTRNHGGAVLSQTDKAGIEVKIRGDNSIMTASVMYAAARAAKRMKDSGRYGCFTMAEIVPLDFVKGNSVAERLAAIKY